MPDNLIPADPGLFGATPATVGEHNHATFGVIGMPFGVPYGSTHHARHAPQTIREQSLRIARHAGNYDFDLEHIAPANLSTRLADYGNVPESPSGKHQHDINERALNTILDAGQVPIILGGDHSIPVSTIRAIAARTPIHLIQFDAHLDYRDEVNGIRDGLSSSIRRASELERVTGITQIGLRGLGSAREGDVTDARTRGNTIVTAREANRRKASDLLAHIPPGTACYITFDMDAMDPAIAPGVIAPAFGGLTWDTAHDLLLHIARSQQLAGVDMVEVAPDLDHHNRTSLLAARLVWTLVASVTTR